MSNRLFIDEIISVGAVSAGDNPDAEITFWKKRVDPIVGSAEILAAYRQVRDMTPKITKRVTKSRQTVDTKGDRMVDFDFEGFTDDQKTAVEGVFTEYEATIADLQPVEEVEVVKEVDPEIQELITKQAAELEEAHAEIAKERKIRRDAEFITKAQTLETVLGPPEEWGPVLDELESAAPEAYEKLTARLAVAKTQIETGDLFKEIGRAGDGESDKVAALTKAKLELNPELTVEQARAQVWQENPELVEEARSL